MNALRVLARTLGGHWLVWLPGALESLGPWLRLAGLLLLAASLLLIAGRRDRTADDSYAALRYHTQEIQP